MTNCKEHSNLGKCPICAKDAEFIDKRSDACCTGLRKCDENEFYKCYKNIDNENLRFVKRKSETDKDYKATL